MKWTEEKENILREKLIPLIEKEGFRVFELRVFYAQGKLFLRILIDFKEGGINLEDCAYINRKVSNYLDENNILDTSFILEVSSPGVRKELVNLKDFLRVKGRKVRIWLREEHTQREFLEAKIAGVNEEKIEVILEDKGKIFSIPLEKIRKAIQKIN